MLKMKRYSVSSKHWLVLYISFSMCLSACFRSDEIDPDTLYARDTLSEVFDVSPVRTITGKLRLHRDGEAYECSMCHDGYRNDPDVDPLGDEHSDIVFDHGVEQHCLHCHNPKNSDVYVNHDGTEIPENATTTLCAKCHGMTFRDWQEGVHGRKSRFWDERFGTRLTLECIECHDPHAPRFPQMKPDPAPLVSRFDTRPSQTEKGVSDE